MAMRLTCTKHKLYDLLVAVRGAGGMPPFGKCRFTKAPRSRAWWMEWSTKAADYEVYFTTCAGVIMLRISVLPEGSPI